MFRERYPRPEGVPEPSLSDPILQQMDWILDDPTLFNVWAQSRLCRSGRRRHHRLAGDRSRQSVR